MLRHCNKLVKIGSLSRLTSNNLLPTQLHKNYLVFSAATQEKFIQHARYSSQYKAKEDNFRQLISEQDSDSFGSLSVNTDKADNDFQDEDDIKEEKFIKNPPRRNQQLSTKQYADIIKDHIRRKQIKEAIDVLEIKMKDDGYQPENYIFNLLIDGCARVGYTKKAFNLFTRMRQRGLKVTGATYTSLFNACANGPYKHEDLERANRLREVMLEKGFVPNISNYHSMMKAYGRCGDLKTAFLLVDEMIEKEITVTTETFNFLLQACASDKELGFRHALLVWHKMYQKKLKPDIYSFNLMLRCCRDTELGDVKSTKEVIQTILLRNPKSSSEKNIAIEQIKLIEDNSSNDNIQIVVDKSNEEEDTPLTPNLLTPKPHLGNLIDVKEVKKPEDRLLLLGGFSGFLDLMQQCEVKPDLKTFTALIEVIPSTTIAEVKLIKTIRKADIKCDVDFFNILIKKRSMRFDYDGAREVVDGMIKRANLQPDIVTFGVLSLGCQSREQAWDLINEMNENGIRMNMPILGAMLKQGCCTKNFEYIMDILNIMKKFQMQPNDRIMETLNIFIRGCNFLKKKDNKNLPYNFRKNVRVFKEHFEKWKTDMGLNKTETEQEKNVKKERPWDQFEEAQADGYEDPKCQKLQRKQKLRRFVSRIKAIGATKEESKEIS